MSESVVSCLEYFNSEGTQQTRLFISLRMVDRFFDCLNVKSLKLVGRPSVILETTRPGDEARLSVA